MTDGKSAHLSAPRIDSVPGRDWAAMREQVREIIRAEVDKLNPTEDARRPLELIIESSIRYSAADDGMRIRVVDARGQPRTIEKDGKAADFTIRDLLEELRHTHPALFRSPERNEPRATAPETSAHPSPGIPKAVEEPRIRPRDWLSVSSGEDGPGGIPLSHNRTLFRLRRGKVRFHGWSGKAIRSGRSSPAPERVPEPAYVPDRNLFSLDRVRNVFGGERSRSRARGQALGVAAVALLALVGIGAAAFLGQARLGQTRQEQTRQEQTGLEQPRSSPEASVQEPAETGTFRTPQTAEAAPPRPLLPRGRTLRGVPDVIDTATLSLQGEVIRLFGVEWAPGGGKPDDLTRYLQGRETICEPMGENDLYRCQVGGQDLSRVVLFNGGGKPTSEATPDLKAAADKAREARLGVWRE